MAPGTGTVSSLMPSKEAVSETISSSHVGTVSSLSTGSRNGHREQRGALDGLRREGAANSGSGYGHREPLGALDGLRREGAASSGAGHGHREQRGALDGLRREGAASSSALGTAP